MDHPAIEVQEIGHVPINSIRRIYIGWRLYKSSRPTAGALFSSKHFPFFLGRTFSPKRPLNSSVVKSSTPSIHEHRAFPSLESLKAGSGIDTVGISVQEVYFVSLIGAVAKSGDHQSPCETRPSYRASS